MIISGKPPTSRESENTRVSTRSTLGNGYSLGPALG